MLSEFRRGRARQRKFKQERGSHKRKGLMRRKGDW